MKKTTTKSNSHKKTKLTVRVKKTKKHAKKKQHVLSDSDQYQILEQAYYHGDSISNYKKFIMISGVSFFMIIITVLWAYNMRAIINTPVDTKNDSGSIDAATSYFEEVKESFSDERKELQKALDEIKALSDKQDALVPEESEIENTIEEEVKFIEEKLIEINNLENDNLEQK